LCCVLARFDPGRKVQWFDTCQLLPMPGAAFRETCGELLQRLSFYDRSISCDEQAPSMPACFEAIGHRSPSFTLQQPDGAFGSASLLLMEGCWRTGWLISRFGGKCGTTAKLRLLKFLCTELQCERMVYHRTHKAARYGSLVVSPSGQPHIGACQ